MSYQAMKSIIKKYPSIEHFARKIISTVPMAFRLGKDFWWWYNFYEESEKWASEQLMEFQLYALRTLLHDISENSPYYVELLKGIDIDCITKHEHIKELLPTLSRQQFRDNYKKIRSQHVNEEQLVKSCTSGTTGMALQFYHINDGAREWAAICHQWKRVGYDPSKSLRVEFRGLTELDRLINYYPEHNMMRCSILNLDAKHIKYYAEEIRKHPFGFFHGYPSALYLLSKVICSTAIRFPQPKAILLASENVYDWQIDEMERAFPNSKIYAHYGCAERTVLGGWCEYRREYHMMPQYSIVEVDPNTSQIIGTNLYNKVNAFVRYQMTDTVGGFTVETCPDCHRPYVPRFTQILGRAEDYLYSPENGWIPPAIVTYPLKSIKYIKEIQFYQKEKAQIEVRYSTLPTLKNAELNIELQQIRNDLCRLFGKQMKFLFSQVDDFERTPVGKFKWIICEIQKNPTMQL